MSHRGYFIWRAGAAASAAALALFLGPAAQAVPSSVSFTDQLFNGVIGALPQQADGVSGESTYKNPRDRSASWWPRLPTSTLTFSDGSARNQSYDAATAARGYECI